MSGTHTYSVEIVERGAQPTVVIRARVELSGIAVFLGGAFAEIAALLHDQHVAIAGPPFARYQGQQGGVWVVEAGFPYSGAPQAHGRARLAALPAGPTARTLHVGPYEDVVGAYEALYDWLKQHGYRPLEQAWESYLDEPDAPAPRTEVCMPCRAVAAAP